MGDAVNKGIFITLEGGDGTGKSTQVRLLADALVHAGISVELTREIGGTPQAEKIRDLVVQRDANWDALAEAAMISAARREHLTGKIWPALKAGKWVVSDRFADSTAVFQGYGRGVDLAVIDKLYELVAGDFQPDVTFIFDQDPNIGLQRTGKRFEEAGISPDATEDRFERMGVSFQEKVRQGYLDIARRFPDRCVVIDASKDIESVHADVMAEIKRRFGVGGKAAAHG